MNLAAFTKARCPELSDALEVFCKSPLAFDGDHPLGHSSHNHIQLYALEYWATRHSWIDLEYRVDFVQFIFKRWRGRLKGLEPYANAGYRLYLYESVTPSISVVAETPHGFPLFGTPQFVQSPRDVMALYLDGGDRFDTYHWEVTHEQILAVVEKRSGSVGKPSANALGLQVGRLRTLIEQMSLADEVNAIRKNHGRRPVTFKSDDEMSHSYLVYEQRLPRRY